MLKRALFAVLLSLLAAGAFAQATTSASANFAYKYDIDGGTATYCRLEGSNGDPYATFKSGRGRIETSGSSTTVTGVNAADDVFTGINVGDVIYVNLDGVSTFRVVTVFTSVDQVTVDSAIDLSSGYTWSYKSLQCGTSTEDGWIDVGGWLNVLLGFAYDAGDITTLSVTWECKGSHIGATPQRVYPGPASDCGDGTLNGTVCEFTTVGDALSFNITDSSFSVCRIGLFTAGDGGTRDEVTVSLNVSR